MMNSKLLRQIAILILFFHFISGCTSTRQDDPDFQQAIADAETDSAGDLELDDSTSDQSETSESAQAGDDSSLEDALGDSDSNDQTSEADELEDNLAQTDTIESDDAFQENKPESPKVEDQALLDESKPPSDSGDSSLDAELDKTEDLSFEEQMTTPTPLNPTNEITNIEFRGNQSGGTVVISARDPIEYTSRLNSEKNQFVVEIKNANLPERLKRPYIMKDFGSQFRTINAYQSPGSNTARVVVQLASTFKPVVSQEGSRIMVLPTGSGPVEVAGAAQFANPLTKAAPPPSEFTSDSSDQILGARTLDEFLTENTRFYGKPISIEFSKEADVRDIINFIAEESGANIVMSDTVEGQLSLKLRKVPWDQALVIVMRSKNLGYVRQGNVIRISTLKQLQEEANSAKAIIEAQKLLAPQRVKVIPVSFAKVEDMVTQVKPFLTAGQGQIVADNRTSTLIITDTDEKITKVSRLIKELDIPPAQVMIEGKFVEAQERFTQEIGVNWSLSGSPVPLSTNGGANGAPINFTPNLNIQNVTTVLPVTLGVNVGILDLLGDLNATLALAESDNLVKVISSPRIVTINKEVAEIKQSGQVLSLSTIDNNGTTSRRVERNPVVLNLKVTPQITNDGSVIMDLEVKREFPGALEDRETLARAINSREAKTKVLVQNGQTAVIGGIYTNDQTSAETGVPVLKDIPILGWLFKGQSTDKSKNELLIFLTPRILNLKEQQINSEG